MISNFYYYRQTERRRKRWQRSVGSAPVSTDWGLETMTLTKELEDMLRARALQDLEQDTGNNTFITQDVQSDLIISYNLKRNL